MDASQAGSIRRPSPPSDGRPAAPSHAERAQSFHIVWRSQVADAARPPLRPLRLLLAVARCVRQKQQQQEEEVLQPSPSPLSTTTARRRAGSREGSRRRRRDESLRAWTVSARARAISIVSYTYTASLCSFCFIIPLVPGLALAPVGSGRRDPVQARCCWN